MAQYGFYFDQTRCTGCYTCQVACKDWHDIEAGPAGWLRVTEIEEGEYPTPFLAYLVLTCWHCKNPACLKACPADAIVKREEDGIVTTDAEKCLGEDECGALCQKACPWDAPRFGPEPNAKMRKCNLCIDSLKPGRQPVCVESCPMFALDAGPINELIKKYGDLRQAAGFRYIEKLGPSVIFKPKVKN